MTKLILLGQSGKIHLKDSADIFIGISSRVSRQRHIILIDYDKSRKIIDDCKFFIKKYEDSNYYIFKSSKGKRMAMCFRPVTLKEYFKRLLEADCCTNFRYYTIRSGTGTLRICKKPKKKSSEIKLIKIIKSSHNKNESKEIKAGIYNIINMEADKSWL